MLYNISIQQFEFKLFEFKLFIFEYREGNPFMDNSFHYLIMAEHSIFQKELLSRLKGTGLTIGQPKILDYLLEHDGAAQKDIAHGCHIEPGTLTTLLNRMEENKLVERRTINGNRRSYYVYMTDTGRQAAVRVSGIFRELEEKAFEGVPESDRSLFMDIFFRIFENTTQLQFS